MTDLTEHLARGDEMYREAYFQIQRVLDTALGDLEENGAGQGIVADVALLAAQRDNACAHLDRVTAELAVLQDRVDGDAWEQLTKQLAQANAKLAAVREFAEGMRGYCSPHGVSVHYADQLTAVLDATPAAVLPALPKDDRGATRPVLAVACPTCQAKPGMACANRAAEHSHIKRRLAHSGAIITDPTPTVALTDADMADMGLDPETGLHVRPTPDAAPVVAEEAPARHGYTEHGHHCCTLAPVGIRPHRVARCGGPILCAKCRASAAQLHAAPAVVPAATDRPVA